MDLEIYNSMPSAMQERIIDELKIAPEDPKKVVQGACQLLGIPYLDVKMDMLDRESLNLYRLEKCRELKFLPLYRTGVYLVCAVSRPWAQVVINSIKEIAYDEIRVVGVEEHALLVILDQLLMIEEGIHVVQEREPIKPLYGWGGKNDRELVRSLIRNAYLSDASDIHFEPMTDRLAIKFRINGLLQVQQPVESKYMFNVVDAIKMMAGVPVADRQTLKDGSFSCPVDDRKKIDLRFVALPMNESENIVLRLLDGDKIKKLVGRLPFEGSRLDIVNNALNMESGLILVTGPTGSGKSTTLYTLLLSMDLAKLNVRTVEDPIEYRIEKIIQTQVDRKNDVTTTNALRRILRADPDVILVGEIRDEETAELAKDASNTGHLVLGTLHTNDAPSAVGRLRDLKLHPSEIQSNLTLTIAQRLIQVICPHCKTWGIPSPEVAAHYEWYKLTVPEKIPTAQGCVKCRGTGVVGRKPIFQFMEVNAEIRDMIGAGASLEELRRANNKFHIPLAVDALEVLRMGLTSHRFAKDYELDQAVLAHLNSVVRGKE